MNDVISRADGAFQKERGLSLVERGGLVALTVGLVVLVCLTTNYFRSHYRYGSSGCGPYACCSNTIDTVAY